MSYLNFNDDLDKLKKFPKTNTQVLFIDPGSKACSQEELKPLIEALPDDYKIHIPEEYKKDGSNYSDISQKIEKDLLIHSQNPELSKKLALEVAEAVNAFYSITQDLHPLASLRIVTEEYVKKEYPSVSQLYHRDSTSLTLTKCFYGNGAVYTTEDNINRNFFTTNSIATEDRFAVFDPSIEIEVKEKIWVLLKGEMWKGIDIRSQSLFDYVLGENARIKDYSKGIGFIHKGGYFNKSKKRLVFTISTWKTDF
ncbi:MAG: hypothetical protein L6Q37_17370 [Bdellovibrionaceae bacterium]|nr:hypothetical protein [Pseudobdellovibrionaceae bacterium]NUM60367.1 hypothetical protein [Pseudobdellovibrionaceae bacterium]